MVKYKEVIEQMIENETHIAEETLKIGAGMIGYTDKDIEEMLV